eukprot:Blabericola_migrator_1__4112@NODE_2251_length_3055_cov_99_790495_g1418_i0_p1_GENE_NODE_2251_length_3055_cov_99_790495_g1418_i0NODE_2251_length_3055_cov_99_790495_g1418_i0_p1_ORF_typecomplete_len505_score56_16_NODE_2251_length_3055_cov_99_790495_g1418_i07942308
MEVQELTDYVISTMNVNQLDPRRQEDFRCRVTELPDYSRAIACGVDKRELNEDFKLLDVPSILVKRSITTADRHEAASAVISWATILRQAKFTEGLMAGSATGMFWHDYNRIADNRRFQSDSRMIWRLLCSESEVMNVIIPKLLTLNLRLRPHPAVVAQSAPSITILFFELLLEGASVGVIPIKYRVAYRHLLRKYQDINFTATDVCSCCARRVCLSDFLGGLKDTVWPEEIFPTRQAAAGAAAWKLNGGQLPFEWWTATVGRRRALVLEYSFDDILYAIMRQSFKYEGRDTVVVHDFIYDSIRAFRKGLHPLETWPETWRGIGEAFDTLHQKIGHNELAAELLSIAGRDLLSNADVCLGLDKKGRRHRRRKQQPQTRGQDLWLKLSRFMEEAHDKKDLDLLVTPLGFFRIFDTFNAKLSEWVEIASELASIGVRLGPHLRELENLITMISCRLLHAGALDWPVPFHEHINRIIGAAMEWPREEFGTPIKASRVMLLNLYDEEH